MSLTYEALWESERCVWDRIESGTPTDLRTSTKRTVRARLLLELLTTEPHPSRPRPRALHLLGAQIKGELDLTGLTLVCPLALEGCFLDEPVSFDETRAPRVELSGCQVETFTASQLCTRGDLSLRGLTAEHVSLLGARIGGRLDLSGAELLGRSDGPALSAEGLRVEQDMVCEQFAASGEVTVLGARISGRLDLDGAKLMNARGPALSGERLHVDQDVLCGEQFTAFGEVSLHGARIGGQIDFSGARLANGRGPALSAGGLQVEQSMFFARHESRRAAGVPRGRTRRRARTVVRGDPFRADGEVILSGATIGGQLDFSGAKLNNSDGPALSADGLRVDDDMFCREQFTANGEVTLSGARVAGQLDFSGAKLTKPDGRALSADGLQVDQGTLCGTWQSEGRLEPFCVEGETRLVGAHIRGNLNFEGATLRNQSGPALDADGLRVDQDLLCGTWELDGRTRRFVAEGGVRLPRAHIGGKLDFDGATLRKRPSSASGPVEDVRAEALRADRLRVDQGMFCRDGFNAEGEVRLPRAFIGGQLSFRGATLSNRCGPAMYAVGLHVDQSMSFEPLKPQGEREPLCPFRAEGEVQLMGAHIGGQLNLDGAQLANEQGWALSADRLQVDQDMFCRKHGNRRFLAQGGVSLLGARIGAQLWFEGAELRRAPQTAHEVSEPPPPASGSRERGDPSAAPARPGNAVLNADGLEVDQGMRCKGLSADGEVRLLGAHIPRQLDLSEAQLTTAKIALDLTDANVGSLTLRFTDRPEGVVYLRRARMGLIHDEPDTAPKTELDGCTYESLEPRDVEARLKWLPQERRDYSPQPFEQLSAFYRRTGDDAAARRVAIAKQKRRRKTLAPWGKLWSLFLGFTVAHGYRLWQAGLCLVVLLGIGSYLFTDVYHAASSPQPDRDAALTPAKSEPADFEPVIYTLDLLVPVISLGQRTSWNADGGAQFVALGLTVSGWLLTAALLAGIAARRQ